MKRRAAALKGGLRILEVFKPFCDVHVVKDPGLVLTYLSREGAHCTLITQEKEGLVARCEGYDVIRTRKPFLLHTVTYLWRHARDYDVLLLFHTRPLNPLLASVYKLRNPRGIVYLKADMDNTLLNLGKPSVLNYIRRAKLRMNIPFVDLFSVEQQRVHALFRSRYPSLRRRLIHLPNGHGEQELVKPRKFSQRENLIIAVGPVGSYQKGTETILSVIEHLSPELRTWRFVMIGRVLDHYKPELEEFYRRNPPLRDRVVATGNIADRRAMQQYYARAKIIFMPSRFETFSLALLEAAHYGVVIVGTPVGGVDELTASGRHGALCEFDDIEALARELHRRMHNDRLLQRESRETKRLCDRDYGWPSIVSRLHARLQQEHRRR